jgi:riboflavin synthase alpha subunit
MIVGADGKSMVAPLGIRRVSSALRMKRPEIRKIGRDFCSRHLSAGTRTELKPMFTGLIEDVGRVYRWEKRKASGRLVLKSDLSTREMALGSSIAVNGACLTVIGKARRRFAVDVSPETLRRTNLQDAAPGDWVNLEQPLRLGERLGGHLVTGHVDGVGKVVSIRAAGEFTLFKFRAPQALMRLLVPKGSVAVDGISLTVINARSGFFRHDHSFTLQHTICTVAGLYRVNIS